MSSKILNRVDVITLRDDNSDEELKSLGVTKPVIKITADPVFTIDVESSLSGNFFIKRAEVPDGTKFCVVSIREWQKAKSGFEEIVAGLCDHLYKKYNIAALFVPMQYPADMEISRRIIDKMQTKAYLINRELSVPEIFSVLSECEMVIGMRLHSLIYATTLEKPALALSYDPKISAFMNSISQPDNLDVETLDLDEALCALEGIVENREERSEILAKTNLDMRAKARENADYAINLITKNN
jgi:polysaccharide pyruvyl transferase WcaK-like protein